MPSIGDKASHYDNLADLINRMSSFDSSLFKRLLEIVLNELRPANQYEVKVFKTYSKMLAELEMLIMCRKIRNDSIDSHDGANNNSSSSQAQKTKEEEEAALDDENLCPICYNKNKDTKFIPCQHISCRVCIQTHRLNK